MRLLTSALGALLVTFSLASTARGADLTPFRLSTGEYLLVASFDSAADSLCFRKGGEAGAGACASQHLAITVDTFIYAGVTYRLKTVPAGALFVAVKTVSLAPGDTVRASQGNSGGTGGASVDRYVVPAPVVIPGPVVVPSAPALIEVIPCS